MKLARLLIICLSVLLAVLFLFFTLGLSAAHFNEDVGVIKNLPRPQSAYVIRPDLPHAPTAPLGPCITGTLQGIVYNADTLRGIPQARIHAIRAPTGTISVTVAQRDGGYQMHLGTGAYTVAVQAYGYAPKVITVDLGCETKVDVPLELAPSYTVTGQVYDTETEYPVLAYITVTGQPFDPLGYDEVTVDGRGRYTLTLPGHITYTLSSVASGYAGSVSYTVGPLVTDTVQNFALSPDLLACTALGYDTGLHWTTVFSENFEGGLWWPGWDVVINGSQRCGWDDWVDGGAPNYTGGAGDYAVADSCGCNSSTPMDTELRSPSVDLSGFHDAQLEFKSDFRWGGHMALGKVDLSLDNGSSWPLNVLYRYKTKYYGPETVTVPLAEAAGVADARVRFHYHAHEDQWWEVDEVRVRGSVCEPIPDAVVLQPERIEDEACACTSRAHTLAFANHTGLTDTVLLAFTTSPSVTLLEVPTELGVVPDGSGRAFDVHFKIDEGAVPGLMTYVTVTVALSSTPSLSDTSVIATRVPLIWGWETVGTTPFPVQEHAMVATDDSLYQIGGLTQGATRGTSRTLRYDLGTGTWTQVASMPFGAYRVDGARVSDTLYIPGGALDATTVDDRIQIYSPTVDGWTFGAAAGRDHVGYAASAMNGFVYRIAGGDPTNDWSAVNNAKLYKPETDVWGIPSSPIDYFWRVRWPCMGVIGDVLYVVGGLEQDDKGMGNAALYMQGMSDWDAPSVSNLPVGVALWGAADFVQNGKLVCAGGIAGGITGTVTNTVWVYDPAVDTWYQDAPLPVARAQAEGDVAAGRGYILGGYGDGGLVASLVRALPCPECACDLTFGKTSSDGDVYVGQVFSYALSLHNTGEITVDAVLTDVLPTGVDYADDLVCVGGGMCDFADQGEWVLWSGEIAPREYVTVTFDVTATAPVSASVVNSATVAYKAMRASTWTTLTEIHTVTVTAAPILTWTREAYINGTPVDLSGPLSFTVMVSDTLTLVETLTYTGHDARFTRLALRYPDNAVRLVRVAHTSGVTGWLADGRYGWAETLSPGARVVVTKTLVVAEIEPVSLVTQLEMDGLPSVSRTLASEPLRWVKHGPERAYPGERITYTLSLSLPGALVGPVWLTDALPAGLMFADMLTSTAGSAWYSPTDRAVYARFDTQPSNPEVRARFNVTVTAEPESTVINRAWLMHNGGQQNVSTTLEVPRVAMTITPGVLNTALNPDVIFTRTLWISNAGTGDLTWQLESVPDVAWLQPAATQGTVLSQEQVGLSIAFGTAALIEGVYTTTLYFTGNVVDLDWVAIPVTLTVYEGCIPVAGTIFAVEPTTPYAVEVFTLSAEVAQGTQPVTYAWKLEDGVFRAARQLTYTYSLSGSYPVVLTATNLCSMDVVTRALQVKGTPQMIVGSAKITNVLNPEAIAARTLVMSNTGTAELHWRLAEEPEVAWLILAALEGTLAPEDSQRLTLIMNATGLAPDVYTTTIQGYDGLYDSPVLSISVTLTVTEACVPVADATFTSDPMNPQAGTPVLFSGQVAQGTQPITYTWTLGDEVFYDARQISYTYPISGSYAVVMTATNACGVDGVERAIQVGGISHMTVTPSLLEAVLNPDDNVARGLVIKNTGTAELRWRLAESPDVIWLLLALSEGVLAPAEHEDVTVIVTSVGVTTGTYTTTIQGYERGSKPPVVSIPAFLTVTSECIPVAGMRIASDPVTPEAGVPVVLTAQASQGTQPITYTWDFAGSVLRHGNVVTHTYPARGMYPLTVTATNLCGREVLTHEVNVTGQVTTPCQPVVGAAFAYTPTALVAGQGVTFTGTVSQGDLPVFYTWRMGQPVLLMGNPVTYTFPLSSAGLTRTIWMTATNNCPSHAVVARDLFISQWRYYGYLPLLMRGD